jgi:hypothetical protein
VALLPLVVYCVAAGIYFGPVVRHTGTYSEIGQVQRAYFPWAGAQGQGRALHPQSDYPNSYYPRPVWLNGELRAGELPDWNPYSLGGSPLLANGGGITFHPLRYALARTVAPAIVHDLFALASMVAAGLGAHVLARELGARRAGAYLAGTAWMFHSTFLGWSQLEMMPAIIAGLPWALWGLHRWRRTDRAVWAAVGGVAAGLMPLGGSIDFSFVAYGVCGLAALCWGQRGVGRGLALRERVRWRRLSGPVVFGATAVAIGAPAILPFARLSPWLARQPPSTDNFDANVAVPAGDFLRAFWPQGGAVTDRVLHRLAFAGTIVGVLAVVGLVSRGRRAALGRALVIGSFLWIAHTPISEALGELAPSYRSLSLGRFLFVWNLGLVLLASEALDRAIGWVDVRRHHGAHLRRPSRGTVVAVPLVVAALIALNAGQLFAYGRHLNPSFQPYAAAELLPETPAIAALRDVDGELGGGRFLPVRFATGARVMGASLPMAFGLESGAGYESTFLEGTAATWRIVAGEDPAEVVAHPPDFGYFADFVVDEARPELLARNGITTVLSPPLTDTYPAWDAFAAGAGGLEQRYAAPDGEVWSLREPAPRAFVARGDERPRSRLPQRPHLAVGGGVALLEPAGPGGEGVPRRIGVGEGR